MSGDRTVKFVFEVDQASVNNVKRAFTEIVNASKAMADALKTAGAGGIMGGGNVGARPAAGAGSMQSATAAQKSTLKLDVISPDALKNFKDFVTAVKAGANDIKTSLGPTIQLIANLNSQLAQLKASAGSTGGAGGNIQSPSWFQPPTGTVVGGQQAPLQTFLVNQAAAAQATGGGTGMGMGGGGGGGMGGGGAGSVVGGIAQLLGLGGMMGIGALGYAAHTAKTTGIAYLNELQYAPMGEIGLKAVRSDLMSQAYSSTMQGDYRYGYATALLSRDAVLRKRVSAAASYDEAVPAAVAAQQSFAEKINKRLAFGTGGWGGIVLGGAMDFASSYGPQAFGLSGELTKDRALLAQAQERGLPTTLGLGKSIGVQSPAGTSLSDQRNIDNITAASTMRNIEQLIASMGANEKYALSNVSAEMDSRTNFSRIFGLSRKPTFVLDPTTGTMTTRWDDQIKALEERLVRAGGYSKEEWGSASLSMRTALGTGTYGGYGFQNAQSALMGARGAGYSGLEGLLSGSIRAGYGMRGFNTAMGFGDPIAGKTIGEAVIGQGWSPDQFTGGLGVMAAMQNAPSMFGQQWNVNSASRAIAGMESSIRNTNLDPATRSNNIIAAIKATRAMGPAGDIGPMGQDMLANLSRTKAMDILASGQVPEGLRNALGPAAYEIIEQYVQNTGPSTLLTARTGAATAGRASNISKWLGRVRETGGLSGLYQAYKNDPAAMAEAQSALGTALANITGSSVEAGIGEIGQEFGFLSGKGATMGAGPFGALKARSTEKAGAEAKGDMISETAKTLQQMGDLVNMAIRNGKQIVETTGSFSEMKGSVDELQKVFGRLAYKLNHDFNLGVALKPGPK